MLARYVCYGPVSAFVCLCLSQVGVLLKWLNTGSPQLNRTIGQGVQFSGAKDLCEIPLGSPQRGRQMQVG